MQSEICKQMHSWAREAEAVALGYWRRTGQLQFKSGREAVTVADREIETLLRERIRAEFPGDRIVGEEFGADDGSGGRVWQIDPIDGTLNFALGLPGFCTSLALVDEGRVIAACVQVPVGGDSYLAEIGQGAWRNGEPIHVSERSSLAEAIVSVQFKSDGRYVQDSGLTTDLHTRIYKLRRIGAIALELARVADGAFDALAAAVPNGIQPYDVAAGLLLVREAGGVTCDHRGRPYPLGGADLIAGNPAVCKELTGLVVDR